MYMINNVDFDRDSYIDKHVHEVCIGLGKS